MSLSGTLLPQTFDDDDQCPSYIYDLSFDTTAQQRQCDVDRKGIAHILLEPGTVTKRKDKYVFSFFNGWHKS